MILPKPLSVELPYQDPVALFSPFAESPGAILLESARQSADAGRYSYIALEPFKVMRAKDGAVTLNGVLSEADPWRILQQELSRYPIEPLSHLPPLQGGAVGYFGYDLARHLEQLPDDTVDDQGFPDLLLGFYDVILSFDHVLKKAWIVSTGLPEVEPTARQRRAQERLLQWQQYFLVLPELQCPTTVGCEPGAIASNFDRESYQVAVGDVIKAILAGDIFEANIAQRFTTILPDNLPTFDLYRRLRACNAAPFASYLSFGDTVIASASPERFLQLTQRQVETRPIKGTAPRHPDAAIDQQNAQALMQSDKDRAENIMIVDLMRNDLSRVCEDHTVQVPQLCGLESFATVHHLVSVVKATLRPEYDAIDLLRATFPGGSITGAPKIRAMEIIETIEPHRRGPYCGSIGFISFTGDMDTSITIRTFVIKNQHVSFHVGGAVVVDSDPAQEYQETLDKAAAMFAALVG